MNLDQAIELLKTAVKHTGNIDQNHIDLTILPTEKRSLCEMALAIGSMSIQSGKITRDEFLRRIQVLG